MHRIVMDIVKNFSLKNFNTFGINVNAKEFVSVDSIEELILLLEENISKEKLILGGGSNMLLTKDIDGLVIHINFKGKKIIRQTHDFVWVECQAGEKWHDFVLWTIDHNFGGLENLSYIPGNVGAAPIQNIGAYGAEIKDHFISCEALEIKTLRTKIFDKQDCNFGYRESIFKDAEKGNYIISSVIFKLTKSNHKINFSYGDISNELANMQISSAPTIKQLSDAIINIRKSKLPEPTELGSGGSFFKNPVISREDFTIIQKKNPEIKYFEISETEIKIPAGWLIEQIGFKGKRFGDAGVHTNQALVLVNYGNATGEEIFRLAQNIQQTVFETFGIKIETEVNII